MHSLRFRPSIFQQHRFNLVEFMLMIIVITTLGSLLFPSLKRTIERSKQITCMNQLRKVSHGFGFFILDHDQHLPYANWSNNRQRVTRGWTDFIQPYLSRKPLTPDESDLLKMPHQKGLSELQCPSSFVGRTQKESNGLTCNFSMPMAGWNGFNNEFIGNATTGLHSKEPYHRPMSDVEEPENTLLLAEMDIEAPFAIQGLGLLVRSPSKQTHTQSNGLTLNAHANYALQLHPESLLGYLFVDGHVEAQNHSAISLIGHGNLEQPEGAWTLKSGD